MDIITSSYNFSNVSAYYIVVDPVGTGNLLRVGNIGTK